MEYLRTRRIYRLCTVFSGCTGEDAFLRWFSSSEIDTVRFISGLIWFYINEQCLSRPSSWLSYLYRLYRRRDNLQKQLSEGKFQVVLWNLCVKEVKSHCRISFWLIILDRGSPFCYTKFTPVHPGGVRRTLGIVHLSRLGTPLSVWTTQACTSESHNSDGTSALLWLLWAGQYSPEITSCLRWPRRTTALCNTNVFIGYGYLWAAGLRIVVFSPATLQLLDRIMIPNSHNAVSDVSCANNSPIKDSVPQGI